MNSKALDNYRIVEEYVRQFCDAHNFSAEELKQVNDYILYPAKKAVVNAMIEEILTPRLQELINTLNTLFTKENK